jgi:hypothetical protein
VLLRDVLHRFGGMAVWKPVRGHVKGLWLKFRDRGVQGFGLGAWLCAGVTAASMTIPPPESSDRTPSIDKPPKCGNKTRRRSETHADHHHTEHTSSIGNTRTTSITKFEPEPFNLATDKATQVRLGGPRGSLLWRCSNRPQAAPE